MRRVHVVGVVGGRGGEARKMITPPPPPTKIARPLGSDVDFNILGPIRSVCNQ